MTRLNALTSVALVAGLAATPAAAQQDAETQNQKTQNQQNQQQDRPLAKPQLSQQGQACVDRLEQMDQQLAELGYGLAGPGGYGVYGTAYRTPAVTADGTDALTRPLRSTPRADMYALMRAGYVMARTGHDQGCQQVVSVVEDIGGAYRQAIRDADADTAGAAQWREQYLAEATSVAELEQPLRADQIIGSDLRNPSDEDLGDVEDVVIGPNGEIRYVIASTGGFIGIGEEQVPVPWNELKVTAAPYRDTLVLDVSEQAFNEAPTLQDGQRQQLATGGEGRIKSFWSDHSSDPQQGQQQQ